MNVSETVRLVQLQLRETAGDEALQQAKELVGYVLGVEPPALMLHHGMELTSEQMIALGELTDRRMSGEPLQYILGEWSFMGLPFLVGPDVLIPRADTEVLCETALRLAKERGYRTALDLCCGSGCIGVSLAKHAGLSVTATDISPACIRMTEGNAARNGVSVEVCRGDLFAAVEGTFELIVSNPPYLSAEDLSALQREVTFEPRLALDGGADGLDFYRRIADAYDAFLSPGGALLLEIGATQAPAVQAIFGGGRIILDYADHPRVIVVEKS